MFVAGDAAHIHSPAGGQGMNTGLQDVANLAWKLAAVLRGGAPDSVLDSYHSERWPVGQKLLETTDRLFARMTATGSVAARLRNALVPLAAGTLSRVRPFRARAFRFISQLGIRYRTSAIVWADAGGWRGGPAPGARAPDATIRRGLRVHDLLSGYRFHVLAFSRAALGDEEIARLSDALATLPPAVGVAIERHVVAATLVGRDPRLLRAESGEAFAAYGLGSGVFAALYLIRPDGHVAWRAPRLDVAGLSAFLAGAFGPAAQASISAPTWAATESASPTRS